MVFIFWLIPSTLDIYSRPTCSIKSYTTCFFLPVWSHKIQPLSISRITVAYLCPSCSLNSSMPINLAWCSGLIKVFFPSLSISLTTHLCSPVIWTTSFRVIPYASNASVYSLKGSVIRCPWALNGILPTSLYSQPWQEQRKRGLSASTSEYESPKGICLNVVVILPLRCSGAPHRGHTFDYRLYNSYSSCLLTSGFTLVPSFLLILCSLQWVCLKQSKETWRYRYEAFQRINRNVTMVLLKWV